MSLPHHGVATVLNSKGEVVGMGIAVERRRVLTCAHVVNAALGRKDDTVPDPPDQSIGVGFPYSQYCEPILGTVSDEGWHPVFRKGEPRREIHDVAVIELSADAPGDAGVAVLSECAPVLDNPFHALRATHDNPQGDPTHGIIGAKAPAPYGIYALRGENFLGKWIEPGFSGGGCWDKRLSLTVGMVATTAKNTTERVAHMIPSTVLYQALLLVGVRALHSGESAAALRQLRAEACAVLAGSHEAAEALATQLAQRSEPLAGAPGSRERCERIVDALLRIKADDAVKVLVAGYLAAPGGPDAGAASAIELVCYHVLPAIYRPDDLRRARASVLGGGALISIPVTYPASVELIMAGADGRRAMFERPQSPKDFPSGQLSVPFSPEKGLDEGGGGFLADFRSYMHGKFLPVGSPGPTENGVEALIEAVLQERLEWDRHRYYYIYFIPDDQDVARRWRDMATRLREMFPSLVVIALEKSPDVVGELKILSGLNRLLCRVARIPWTP